VNALTFPTGELPRVTRQLPAQRMKPLQPVPVVADDSDDAQLIARAQGDGPDAVRAFATIYTRHADTVFRFVYFRVGNRPLAEDLTADTFVRALRRIQSFEWRGTAVAAWLVTIARNLIADHFKSARYRLEQLTGDVLDSDQSDDTRLQPEEITIQNLSDARIFAAVQELNEEQRRCITLRFLSEFSIEETAQAMGKNTGAIKALQYRAVRSLARLLEDA
jgi:RNA polymerase sigma-70 factor (ECF subfamily)